MTCFTGLSSSRDYLPAASIDLIDLINLVVSQRSSYFSFMPLMTCQQSMRTPFQTNDDNLSDGLD
jgi:hypothetical protein